MYDGDVVLVLLPQLLHVVLDVNVRIVGQSDVQPLVAVDLVQPVLLPMDRIEIKSIVSPQLVEILVLVSVWNKNERLVNLYTPLPLSLIHI